MVSIGGLQVFPHHDMPDLHYVLAIRGEFDMGGREAKL